MMQSFSKGLLKVRPPHRSVYLQSLNTITHKSPPVAIAFDVDGVLLRGAQALPKAKAALEKLDKYNIPFILLTNGGGYTEAEKAASISRVLNYHIKPEQLQLAHTPFKSLVSKYKDEPVLLVGKNQIHRIAHQYGFTNTYDIGDLHHQFPLLFPDWLPLHKATEFERIPTQSPSTFAASSGGHDINSSNGVNNSVRDVHSPKTLDNPLKSVFVMLDPRHYHRDIQILLDVLRSSGVPGVSPDLTANSERPHQPVDLHIAGPDLEYVTEWSIPRLGAGIFPMMLSQIYTASTGKPLHMTLYGKPYPATYEYAEKMLKTAVERVATKPKTNGLTVYHNFDNLNNQATCVNNSNTSIDHTSKHDVDVWMVGDNPLSDIKGAKEAGWKTILVKTGMFQGSDNDLVYPADHVAKDVNEAVDIILSTCVGVDVKMKEL